MYTDVKSRRAGTVLVVGPTKGPSARATTVEVLRINPTPARQATFQTGSPKALDGRPRRGCGRSGCHLEYCRDCGPRSSEKTLAQTIIAHSIPESTPGRENPNE